MADGSQTLGATNSTFNLRIPTEAGKAPSERLPNILDAYGAASVLMEAAKDRWRKMAMVRGMFDGNPPYNPATLRKSGMAYYPNFNSLEAKAYRSNALAPYYDVFSGAPQLVDVQLSIDNKEVQDEASRIVCEEQDLLYRRSRWFAWNMKMMLTDFLSFGKGFLFWIDPTRLAFTHVPAHRVLFPDQTTVDMGTWEMFGVLQVVDPSRLFNKVKDRKAAESVGWQYEAVLQAIRNNAAPYDPSLYDDYVGLQQQLKDHDVYTTARIDKVFLMHIYVREYDGRWTHLIVGLDSFKGQPQVPPSMEGKDHSDRKIPYAEEYTNQNGFLFKRVGQYQRLEHIICPFFFEVLDGSINGIAGLGKDIYPPMQLKDRLWCARANNAFMRSTIVLQPSDSRSREKLQIAQVQNVTILPPGVTVQNGTIFGDMNAAAELNNQFDQMLQTNTGIYRPSIEKPSGNPEPARSTILRAQQATTLSNSANVEFCLQLDPMYAELNRRLEISDEDDCRAYRKACDDRGVPKEMRKNPRYVRCFRNLGNGSVFLRQQQLGTLLAPEIFSHLPADGQANVVQDVIGSVAGQQKVERYMPIQNREQFNNRHAWEAQQENDAIQTGGPVMWYPGQNDLVHLAIHAKAGQEAQQGLQQGLAQPQQVAAFLSGLVQHAVTTHLASLLKNGRKAEAKPFEQIFGHLKKTADALAKQIAAQQGQQGQQQQRQQAAMTDAQLKAAKTQQDMQLKAAKTQQALALKGAQAQQKMAIADAMAASEISRKRIAAFAGAD